MRHRPADHRLTLQREHWTARYFDRAGVGIDRQIESSR